MEKITVALENYLEAVFLNYAQGAGARISAISRFLGVKKPSVVVAIRKLAKRGLASQEKYGYVFLTEPGKKQAQHINKKRGKIYDFLRSTTGINALQARYEASGAAHYFSDMTVEKIAKVGVKKNLLGKNKKKK
ncbi:MAG: metal-dependent transcriptional regulator [bacterium]